MTRSYPGLGAGTGAGGAFPRALLLMGLCLGSLAAQALQIYSTQTFTVPTSPTDPAWSQTIAVNQYNGASPLQGIEFQMTGTLTGSFLITNPSTLYGNDIRVQYNTTVYLARQPDSDIIASALPSYDVTTVFGASEARVISVNVAATDTYTSLPPASDITTFTGTGTVALYVWSLGETYQVTGQSGKQAPSVNFQNPLSQATITVNYLVPEPSGLLLAGFAVAGSLGLRRRRRTSGLPHA